MIVAVIMLMLFMAMPVIVLLFWCMVTGTLLSISVNMFCFWCFRFWCMVTGTFFTIRVSVFCFVGVVMTVIVMVMICAGFILNFILFPTASLVPRHFYFSMFVLVFVVPAIAVVMAVVMPLAMTVVVVMSVSSMAVVMPMAMVVTSVIVIVSP